MVQDLSLAKIFECIADTSHRQDFGRDRRTNGRTHEHGQNNMLAQLISDGIYFNKQNSTVSKTVHTQCTVSQVLNRAINGGSRGFPSHRSGSAPGN